MKKPRQAEMLKTRKLIRINDYTWIEKKFNESDEAARQKFLLKLSKAESSHGSSDQVFS